MARNVSSDKSDEGRTANAMTTEIRVPTLGESVVEATVGQWFKNQGEAVAADEPLVELETDKVTVEVPAPEDGVLAEVLAKEGDTVEVGALLGTIGAGDGLSAAPAKSATLTPADPAPHVTAAPAPAPAAMPTPAAAPEALALQREPQIRAEIAPTSMPPAPAAQKLMEEQGLSPADIQGSGRRGQILKGDVMAASAAAETLREMPREAKPPPAPRAPVTPSDEAREERVRMTRLRQTIAKRLKEAQ
ncbi:MAG: biotin/lipoyl-containing protein, partial [Pseudomonadota bacterium]